MLILGNEQRPLAADVILTKNIYPTTYTDGQIVYMQLM